MKHPDQNFVEKVIKLILAKRRFVDWEYKSVGFAFFPSRYEVLFNNKKDKSEKKVPLVTEFFDEVAKSDTPFTRRRIKKEIKKILLPNDTSPDED